MTLVSDPAEVSRIHRLVQEALDKRQPATYRIEVAPGGVLQDDDWYNVVVQSDADVRTYDFYNILAEAEAELQDEANLNILLVPAVGD
jgi:hypothetical protein